MTPIVRELVSTCAAGGLLLAALLACSKNSSPPQAPAAQPVPPSGGAAASNTASGSDHCYDSCSSSYDQCSNGCLNNQLAQSLQGFGDTAAINAAGDSGQACLDTCNSSRDACSSRCDQEEQGRIAEQSQPAPDPGAVAMGNDGAAPAFQATAAGCDGCGAECDGLKAQCAGGTMSACYSAAACLCACNARNGGCGNDAGFLSSCVADNNAKAASLGSNVPVFAAGPAQLQPTPPAPLPPQETDACDGVRAQHKSCWWHRPGQTCPTYSSLSSCGSGCKMGTGSASPAC